MTIWRRELIAYGTASALTALGSAKPTEAEEGLQNGPPPSPMPMRVASDRGAHGGSRTWRLHNAHGCIEQQFYAWPVFVAI
jgi:hypothetical protein